MSRVQLALNVGDIDEAVAFYSKLFGTSPAKTKPGYANFAIDEPPLKLVLIEDETKEPGTLNHLGVEVESRDAVAQAASRLAGEGLSTHVEDDVTCCYALQAKVWVAGPGGEPWELYTVLADVEMIEADPHTADAATAAAACCASRPDLAAPTVASTCC